MKRGSRASSVRAERSSATRLARLASDTWLEGRRRSFRTDLGTAAGRRSSSASRSRKALGEMWTTWPSRKSSRLSVSSVNSPKLMRTRPPIGGADHSASGTILELLVQMRVARLQGLLPAIDEDVGDFGAGVHDVAAGHEQIRIAAGRDGAHPLGDAEDLRRRERDRPQRGVGAEAVRP